MCSNPLPELIVLHDICSVGHKQSVAAERRKLNELKQYIRMSLTVFSWTAQPTLQFNQEPLLSDFGAALQ